MEARQYLLGQLGSSGLSGAEVGVVGDTNHWGGYHTGRDRLNARQDYSVVESSRDQKGLSNAASALDIGTFSFKHGGKTHTLQDFSKWLAKEAARGAKDTQDIREIIYSPDGKTVKRWDRLGKRSGGDSSHLGHTHISYFRDSEARDKTAVFRRWIDSIKGTTPPTTEPPKPVAKPSTPKTNWTEDLVKSLPELRKGSKGKDVAFSQALLAANGFSPANSFDKSHRPDGDAGPGWDASVRAFQRAKKLDADGIVGPRTWAALLGR